METEEKAKDKADLEGLYTNKNIIEKNCVEGVGEFHIPNRNN